MQQQKFYIKGMVCQRCIYSVKQALEGLGIEVTEVDLGEVTLLSPSETDESLIEERLKSLGFSLLRDKRLKLVKDTKALVAEVYSGGFDFPNGFRFSALAAERLHTNYDGISAAFSAVEQTTLEKYIIDFRIEKIKELLVYTDHSLADIAFALGFSSVAHLSRQFKNCTGLNPSYFKEIKSNKSSATSVSDT
jgi:AraC family transcriptional regulator